MWVELQSPHQGQGRPRAQIALTGDLQITHQRNPYIGWRNQIYFLVRYEFIPYQLCQPSLAAQKPLSLNHNNPSSTYIFALIFVFTIQQNHTVHLLCFSFITFSRTKRGCSSPAYFYQKKIEILILANGTWVMNWSIGWH